MRQYLARRSALSARDKLEAAKIRLENLANNQVRSLELASKLWQECVEAATHYQVEVAEYHARFPQAEKIVIDPNLLHFSNNIRRFFAAHPVAKPGEVLPLPRLVGEIFDAKAIPDQDQNGDLVKISVEDAVAFCVQEVLSIVKDNKGEDDLDKAIKAGKALDCNTQLVSLVQKVVSCSGAFPEGGNIQQPVQAELLSVMLSRTEELFFKELQKLSFAIDDPNVAAPAPAPGQPNLNITKRSFISISGVAAEAQSQRDFYNSLGLLKALGQAAQGDEAKHLTVGEVQEALLRLNPDAPEFIAFFRRLGVNDAKLDELKKLAHSYQDLQADKVKFNTEFKAIRQERLDGTGRGKVLKEKVTALQQAEQWDQQTRNRAPYSVNTLGAVAAGIVVEEKFNPEDAKDLDKLRQSLLDSTPAPRNGKTVNITAIAVSQSLKAMESYFDSNKVAYVPAKVGQLAYKAAEVVFNSKDSDFKENNRDENEEKKEGKVNANNDDDDEEKKGVGLVGDNKDNQPLDLRNYVSKTIMGDNLARHLGHSLGVLQRNQLSNLLNHQTVRFAEMGVTSEKASFNSGDPQQINDAKFKIAAASAIGVSVMAALSTNEAEAVLPVRIMRIAEGIVESFLQNGKVEKNIVSRKIHQVCGGLNLNPMLLSQLTDSVFQAARTAIAISKGIAARDTYSAEKAVEDILVSDGKLSRGLAQRVAANIPSRADEFRIRTQLVRQVNYDNFIITSLHKLDFQDEKEYTNAWLTVRDQIIGKYIADGKIDDAGIQSLIQTVRLQEGNEVPPEKRLEMFRFFSGYFKGSYKLQIALEEKKDEKDAKLKPQVIYVTEVKGNTIHYKLKDKQGAEQQGQVEYLGDEKLPAADRFGFDQLDKVSQTILNHAVDRGYIFPQSFDPPLIPENCPSVPMPSLASTRQIAPLIIDAIDFRATTSGVVATAEALGAPHDQAQAVGQAVKAKLVIDRDDKLGAGEVGAKTLPRTADFASSVGISAMVGEGKPGVIRRAYSKTRPLEYEGMAKAISSGVAAYAAEAGLPGALAATLGEKLGSGCVENIHDDKGMNGLISEAVSEVKGVCRAIYGQAGLVVRKLSDDNRLDETMQALQEYYLEHGEMSETIALSVMAEENKNHGGLFANNIDFKAFDNLEPDLEKEEDEELIDVNEPNAAQKLAILDSVREAGMIAGGTQAMVRANKAVDKLKATKPQGWDPTQDRPHFQAVAAAVFAAAFAEGLSRTQALELSEKWTDHYLEQGNFAHLPPVNGITPAVGQRVTHAVRAVTEIPSTTSPGTAGTAMAATVFPALDKPAFAGAMAHLITKARGGSPMEVSQATVHAKSVVKRAQEPYGIDLGLGVVAAVAVNAPERFRYRNRDHVEPEIKDSIAYLRSGKLYGDLGGANPDGETKAVADFISWVTNEAVIDTIQQGNIAFIGVPAVADQHDELLLRRVAAVSAQIGSITQQMGLSKIQTKELISKLSPPNTDDKSPVEKLLSLNIALTTVWFKECRNMISPGAGNPPLNQQIVDAIQNASDDPQEPLPQGVALTKDQVYRAAEAAYTQAKKHFTQNSALQGPSKAYGAEIAGQMAAAAIYCEAFDREIAADDMQAVHSRAKETGNRLSTALQGWGQVRGVPVQIPKEASIPRPQDILNVCYTGDLIAKGMMAGVPDFDQEDPADEKAAKIDAAIRAIISASLPLNTPNLDAEVNKVSAELQTAMRKGQTVAEQAALAAASLKHSPNVAQAVAAVITHFLMDDDDPVAKQKAIAASACVASIGTDTELSSLSALPAHIKKPVGLEPIDDPSMIRMRADAQEECNKAQKSKIKDKSGIAAALEHNHAQTLEIIKTDHADSWMLMINGTQQKLGDPNMKTERPQAYAALQELKKCGSINGVSIDQAVKEFNSGLSLRPRITMTHNPDGSITLKWKGNMSDADLAKLLKLVTQYSNNANQQRANIVQRSNQQAFRPARQS